MDKLLISISQTAMLLVCMFKGQRWAGNIRGQAQCKAINHNVICTAGKKIQKISNKATNQLDRE